MTSHSVVASKAIHSLDVRTSISPAGKEARPHTHIELRQKQRLTQALKRTADALSTGGGIVFGIAVPRRWWQRRPAA